MDIQPNSFMTANQAGNLHGAVELAAAQIKTTQDAREQEALALVRLVESAAQTAPAPEGSKGHNLDVYA